jgi:hypothetical protein
MSAFRIRGAHAPRVLAMAPRHRTLFLSQSIAARRRNEHARRVRSPEYIAASLVVRYHLRTIELMSAPNRIVLAEQHANTSRVALQNSP